MATKQAWSREPVRLGNQVRTESGRRSQIPARRRRERPGKGVEAVLSSHGLGVGVNGTQEPLGQPSAVKQCTLLTRDFPTVI